MAVAILVAVEATGVLWALSTQDRLVYTEPGSGTRELEAPYTVGGFFFHPYFGYGLSPGRTGEWLDRTWQVNNAGFHGFLPDHAPDYPYEPADNEIIVGIFGGSVATGTALTAQLSDVFEENAPPQWQGKTVRVLNIALPGHRQPQQAFAFRYFALLGQHFDAVINIDGFNEVVTSLKNQADDAEWSYPADSLWGAFGRHLESLASNGATSSGAWLAQGLNAMDGYSNACRFGLCVIWGEAMKAVLRFGPAPGPSGGEPQDLQNTAFPVVPLRSVQPSDLLLDRVGDLWAETSVSMADLAERLGIVYIHVLQPNQWDERYGSYDPIDEDHIYGWVIDWVNEGYPILSSRAADLQRAGVNAVDASGLFEGAPWRANYSDDCCHYTPEGYHRLHLAMIEAIAGALSARDNPQ